MSLNGDEMIEMNIKKVKFVKMAIREIINQDKTELTQVSAPYLSAIYSCPKVRA